MFFDISVTCRSKCEACPNYPLLLKQLTSNLTSKNLAIFNKMYHHTHQSTAIHVAFLRLSPSPGSHSPARLHLSASRCFGEDTCITIPGIDAVVMVLQPSEPRITITGVERLNRPASNLRASGGVALFQELHIISTVTRADATADHAGMDPRTRW